MTYEYSCGAVVFSRINGEPHYLLIRQNDQARGCHGFPKGHMEPGETKEQTALREIYEEVGLRVRLIEGFRAVEDYALPYPPDTRKQVTFFLAEYENQTVRIQESELTSSCLVPVEEALPLVEYEDSKQVLRDAHAFLTK